MNAEGNGKGGGGEAECVTLPMEPQRRGKVVTSISAFGGPPPPHPPPMDATGTGVYTHAMQQLSVGGSPGGRDLEAGHWFAAIDSASQRHSTTTTRPPVEEGESYELQHVRSNGSAV